MEQEFIQWLCRRAGSHPQVQLGVGDDAALLRCAPDRELVVTTDLLTDGVDFLLGECDAARVGRKALAVNLSDLAAMAAEPIAAFVSLALPAHDAGALARALYEGLIPLAEEFRVALAGGDTNTWHGDLVISVTAVGQTSPAGALRRDGARPGDLILVTGDLGGSILGKHFDFVPRVAEALLLHQRYKLHAGIDISDGLSLDLARLATASHCGAAVNLQSVPISAAALACAQTGPPSCSALDHALADGEDFELLLAAPPEAGRQILDDQPLSVPVTCIGRFVAEPGLWQLTPQGSLQPLPPRGWLHRENDR